MRLENIIDSGKKVLNTSLLVGALAVTPFLGGCSKSEEVPGISEELQERWPIWNSTDLEMNKYSGSRIVYDKQVNIKPEFYDGSMPLKYQYSLTANGLGSVYSKTLNHKFEDFNNYFIYDRLDLVGVVSVDNNNKMVAEAKIDPRNITDKERFYNSNFKVEEFHYSGGLLVFHCVSQFDKGLGMKQEETDVSGKKQRDYFFVLPFGAGK
tara:strand:- start:285 stop:911 length:627 start_codon:yes stop_codon:yes gene_type:complete